MIGTDPHVDRRLSAVAEVEIPFYPGLKVGVPSLPAVVDALAEGRYEVLHLCSPGPAGVAAALVGRVLELPICGSYHTELSAYTALRSGNEALGMAVEAALGAFYGGVRRGALAVDGLRRAAARAGHRERGSLGPRRGRRAASPPNCATGRRTAASACSTRGG